MNRQAIHQYIDDHLEEHIGLIRQWVQQPSVSWDHRSLRECAELVATTYERLGCKEVEVIDGRFHPGVWAYYDAGAPVTLHNYCMFDTRTVRRAEWQYDPWGGDLVSFGPYPRVVMGRGAVSGKGPYVAFLNALSAIIAVEGTLPVNIMFLAEGEELMGSPSYREFVERYRGRLHDVDVSYCPMSSQSADGSVSLGLGIKGLVMMELAVSGQAWGRGPAKPIHSSAAGLVGNVPLRLAHAVAGMFDADGQCAIDGLRESWRSRRSLPQEEADLIQGLRTRFRNRDWQDVLPLGGANSVLGGPGNVSELAGGTEEGGPLMTFLYGPAFNVAGLYSGFLGAGTATTPLYAPSRAAAMIDIRMVVDLAPEEIVRCVRRHLDAHGYADVELTVYACFGHSITPVSNPAVQSVRRTLEEWNVDTAIWPMLGVGGPWAAVPNAFQVPCIRGGVIGGGGNVGVGPDEYLVIDGDGTVAGLAEVEKLHVDLLHNLAEALRRAA